MMEINNDKNFTEKGSKKFSIRGKNNVGHFCVSRSIFFPSPFFSSFFFPSFCTCVLLYFKLYNGVSYNSYRAWDYFDIHRFFSLFLLFSFFLAFSKILMNYCMKKLFSSLFHRFKIYAVHLDEHLLLPLFVLAPFVSAKLINFPKLTWFC